MTSYQQQGFATRREYLEDLAQEYGRKVFIFAEFFGPNEDFDGLITALEDTADDCDE